MAEKKEDTGSVSKQLLTGSAIALGGGIMAKAIRDQAVGAKVMKDLRKPGMKFDPFRNKGTLLDPKRDPETGARQSIFNPERAQRTTEALRADAARLKPMRKQAVMNVAAKQADLRDSGGSVRDFLKIRPKLPEGVRTAATNLGLTSGPRQSKTSTTPSDPSKPKSNVTTKDVRAAIEQVPKPREIKNQFQLRSAAAQIKDQAQPGIVQRLIDSANKPKFKKIGKDYVPPSKLSGVLKTAGYTGAAIAAPKLLDMAGKWNADRLTNKPPAPTKPSKPGAPQPSNQPKVLANERDVQAKFDDIRTEAIKIANNEGWSADEANAYVIKEMKTLGAEYHDYAMKNAKSIR
jgi:hypothetical protein